MKILASKSITGIERLGCITNICTSELAPRADLSGHDEDFDRSWHAAHKQAWTIHPQTRGAGDCL
jgi:hypothetical protein